MNYCGNSKNSEKRPPASCTIVSGEGGPDGLKNPRGKIPDNDVVTFSIFVNHADRGHGAGFFPDLAAGSVTPAAAVTPGSRVSMGVDWIVGPLELAQNDLVSIVYSGSNTSDSELTLETAQQDQIELKIPGYDHRRCRRGSRRACRIRGCCGA